MVSMAAALGRKARDDHIGPEGTDDPHDVAQDSLAVPNPQGFLRRFRKSKINRSREKLPSAIQPPRGQHFLSADHTQLIAEFRPEHVLSAITAREREISRAATSP